MRRAKYEITDMNRLIDIMNSTNIGRMASLDESGCPYITPVNFVFYEGRVYFHCAPEGEKLDNIKRDPRVCFEADVPLAYLEISFNDTGNPCNTHQLFHSVVIRGKARILEDGRLKTRALNALVAKHEKNEAFKPVSEDMPNYKACRVVEITPETITGKSDVAQTKTPERKFDLACSLAGRGLPGDLKAIKAMGFELEGNDRDGWRPVVPE